MSAERLMAQLDGAELVMYDPDGYLLAWFGGESTGVHVYDAGGTEIGYWQIMPADGSGRVDKDTVHDSMISHRMSGEPYPS